ncbi:MAG: CopD family protein [Sphingomonas sp.]
MALLEWMLVTTYLWVKAAHLIFVIFWIAGLFMLPRFYIYQQPTAPGSPEDRQWIERARRLRSIILTPAMIAVWVLGLSLIWINQLNGIPILQEGWLHAKLLIVLALSGYHGWAVAYGKRMARGYRPARDRTLRLMNEVPGIATAIIVILVIVKPF